MYSSRRCPVKSRLLRGHAALRRADMIALQPIIASQLECGGDRQWRYLCRMAKW